MGQPKPPGVAKRAASSTSAQSDQLRALIQGFVRAFGLLASDQTPCGKPLSTSHAHALMFLLERTRREHAPTQQELGAALGIDKSNVARLCGRMGVEGHLVQRRCPEDGRARRLSLTERGHRLATSVERASQGQFAALLEAVQPKARPTLLRSLQALNTAVAKIRLVGTPPEVDE